MHQKVSFWFASPLGRGQVDERSSRWVFVLLLLGSLAAGCARAPVQEGRAKSAGPGVEQIALEAVSFGFIPNRIRVSAGADLRLRVKNTSAIEHNLTVLLPDGKVAKAVDVGSGEAAEFSFRTPAPGRYVIYCNKFLHRGLGMKGVVEAR